MLVTVTHTTAPRYQPARELYPWVDLQPDRMLRSLYTGEVFEPAELIRADFAIEARLMLRAQALAPLSEQDPASIAAQLDEMLPFNCKHVVPQTGWGRR